MSNKIIQWKCRGIRANYEELLLLLNKDNLKVVCLQETFLKDKNSSLCRATSTDIPDPLLPPVSIVHCSQ